MSLLRHPAVGKLRDRLWHHVLILAICLLAANVATRYCYANSSPVCNVKTVLKHRAPDAARQHLEKSAAKWATPVEHFSLLDAPTFYPRIAPAGPPPRDLLFDKSLYNRPPPANSSSFQFRS